MPKDEHLSYIDQTNAEARDWYATSFVEGPASMAMLATVLAADDHNVLRSLPDKALEIVQRLAGLKLHELTRHYADEHGMS